MEKGEVVKAVNEETKKELEAILERATKEQAALILRFARRLVEE